MAFWVFHEVDATCTKVCPEGEDVAHVSLTLPWDSYCWGCGTTVLLPRPAGLPLSPPLSRNGRPSVTLALGCPGWVAPQGLSLAVSGSESALGLGPGSWAPSVSLLGEEPGPEA